MQLRINVHEPAVPDEYPVRHGHEGEECAVGFLHALEPECLIMDRRDALVIDEITQLLILQPGVELRLIGKRHRRESHVLPAEDDRPIGHAAVV